jgi:hypothetical protein
LAQRKHKLLIALIALSHFSKDWRSEKISGGIEVINPSCIKVPSPEEIHHTLFPAGLTNPVSLPPVWTARVLLTPGGSVGGSPIVPSDQLVVGSLIYDASAPSERFMRIKLYLLESRNYYDFLFRTSDGETQWWWLMSDPGKPTGLPEKGYGPFAAQAMVPDQDFLVSNHFSHVGTWDVLGRSRDSFSSAIAEKRPATWYWFNSGTDHLARIMNIATETKELHTENDFKVAVLGAYYLVDFPSFRRRSSSTLSRVHEFCSRLAEPAIADNPMVTLEDILRAMGAPPSGAQIKCTLPQIQALVPGISCPTRALSPPSWTNRVHHECYMIGLPAFPFYSQVWYDWSRGMQVTVMVGKVDGVYGDRFDLFLPKGRNDGPRIRSTWDGSNWIPHCQDPLGVAMPKPNFVKAGHGRCRGILRSNPYFGSLKLWSVPLLPQKGNWIPNFWFWFNQRQKPVIFAFDPPNSLTLIDYQLFIRNAAIKPCKLAQPSEQPPCASVRRHVLGF